MHRFRIEFRICGIGTRAISDEEDLRPKRAVVLYTLPANRINLDSTVLAAALPTLTSGNLTSNSTSLLSFQSPNVMFSHTKCGSSASASARQPDVHCAENTSPVGDVERWTCIASGMLSGQAGCADVGTAGYVPGSPGVVETCACGGALPSADSDGEGGGGVLSLFPVKNFVAIMLSAICQFLLILNVSRI